MVYKLYVGTLEKLEAIVGGKYIGSEKANMKGNKVIICVTDTRILYKNDLFV